MTRESSRRPSFASSHSPNTIAANMQLLDMLWNTVDFPELPSDAPAELRDNIVFIDDPRLVYKVHNASRRHNFQLLVEKFIHQLQHGCGSPLCSTTTCMTCRKRIFGSAPIRRYNPSSARTLAVFMASQDNADRFLCPFIHQDNCHTESLDSLTISKHCGATPTPKKPPRPSARWLLPPPMTAKAAKKAAKKAIKRAAKKAAAEQLENSPRLDITEKTTDKDYRSIPANLFGTMAFRMLEWLTPNSIVALACKASTAEQDGAALQATAGSKAPMDMRRSSDFVGHRHVSHNGTLDTSSTAARPSRGLPPASLSQRNSNARVKPNSSSSGKPLRLSQDSYPATDDVSSSLVSPTPKLGLAKPNRASQISTGRAVNDDEPDLVRPRPVSPPADDTTQTVTTSESNSASVTPPLFLEDGDTASSGSSRDSDVQDLGMDRQVHDSASKDPLEQFAPQTLNRLSLAIVEFIYRTMKDDGTAEKHYFRPARLSRAPPVGITRLMRPGKTRQSQNYPDELKQGWAHFLTQSIYYTMTNPILLVNSFSEDGNLLPTRSLWWGVAKLLDSQPTLVLHSLWVASSSLFSVPKSLQSLKSPTTQVFRTSDVSLTNQEAGYVTSICLHALVALIPEVTNRTVLYDVSRLRSMGLSVTTKSHGTTETYLQCDDAYSDELALRLARRLFSALIARKHYAEMAAMTSDNDEVDPYADVLKPLWDQLDQLNVDLKTMHLERMVTVLLDWARAVILNDWNGGPDFASNTAFAGALELIEQMYHKRKELFISDFNLRIDYLADRLDTVTFPASWLTFPESSKRRHLLSYPYLFSSSTLITYFRAMNFERMNKQHELANSTYETTRLPVNNTPISNMYLADFLYYRMGAQLSKYLVLNIRRDNIVEDTFNQLWGRREFEYVKPLKVHLGEDRGEAGTDLGGVQQEFFQLLIAGCLNPDYGAFTIDSRTRMAWFMPGSIVEDWKFEMIGLVFSLAVHNGITLPVTFPTTFYRRLLGQPVSDIQHIEDGWPDLANGLTTLLEWDETNGTVEDVFARTYEFSVDMFGLPVSRRMDTENPQWPRWGTVPGDQQKLTDENPNDAPMVTRDNRSTYVSDYIKYLTDISVASQFRAFQKGFQTCIHPKSLAILTPAMLQSVVEGVQDIDISEIKRYARYVGYDSSDATIRNFWSVVKRFDDSLKRKLLEFVTASERIPVGGAKNLQFVIQKNGVEEGNYPRLPTAYTCYGTILLPEYQTKEVLKERLCMALENTQGFGFA